MAWDDTLKVHGSCPTHWRFHPANGVGAIKAGCSYCYRLWELYRTFETLKRDIGTFNDATAARRTP